MTNSERITQTIKRHADDATAVHNLTHLQRFVAQQQQAATTGAECPKCGAGVNPTILAAWGACPRCAN